MKEAKVTETQVRVRKADLPNAKYVAYHAGYLPAWLSTHDMPFAYVDNTDKHSISYIKYGTVM
jgi:hypothetical protein